MTEVESQFNCSICDSRYSSKRSLKQHEKTIHENVKFSCKDCGKLFSRKTFLRTHIDDIHLGRKYILQPM